MIIIERTVSLDRMCAVEMLSGVAFADEAGGHKFVITGMRNGVFEAFSGTVGGQVISPGGQKISITSAGIEDGKAWAVLPAACYDGKGFFNVVIGITSGGEHTVIYACTGWMTEV